MDCLVLPKVTSRRSRYRRLKGRGGVEGGSVVVIAGKEKREFLVAAYMLEEDPFRVLVDMTKRDDEDGYLQGGTRRGGGCGGFCRGSCNKGRVVFVDVDAILFEHMLWLMNNDCPSLLELDDLKEIIDFYSQDS